MKKPTFLIFALIAFISMSFVTTTGELLSTSLRITVINELGNIEEGAKVTLYKTQEDFEDETNALDSAVTDKKGRVNFRELEPIVYFVSAIKDERNNYGAGTQTSPLTEGKINKVNIVIE